MEEMLDTISRHRLYGLAAEIRAVEEGHNARVLPDGSILVKAESNPGSYRVFIRGIDDGVLRFGCDCRSGEYRPSLPVPCKHAALAARRLEREGLDRPAPADAGRGGHGRRRLTTPPPHVGSTGRLSPAPPGRLGEEADRPVAGRRAGLRRQRDQPDAGPQHTEGPRQSHRRDQFPT